MLTTYAFTGHIHWTNPTRTFYECLSKDKTTFRIISFAFNSHLLTNSASISNIQKIRTRRQLCHFAKKKSFQRINFAINRLAKSFRFSWSFQFYPTILLSNFFAHDLNQSNVICMLLLSLQGFLLSFVNIVDLYLQTLYVFIRIYIYSWVLNEQFYYTIEKTFGFKRRFTVFLMITI